MAYKEDKQGEKLSSRKMQKVLSRLWRYMQPLRKSLYGAGALALIGNLLALAGPLIAGFAVDAIGERADAADLPRVFYLCGWMLALYILSSALAYVLARVLVSISQKVAYRMRRDVFERLMDLPVSFFDRNRTGDLISRISYDIDTIHASLSNDLVQICTTVITVAGSFIMMLLLSWQMAAIFLILVPVFVLYTRRRTRKVRPLFRARAEKLGAMNAFAEERVSAFKTLRVYHQEENTVRTFAQKNTEAVNAFYAADYYGSAIGPSVNFLNNMMLALLSVLGAVLFLIGRITLGSLSSFVLYSRKFSGPINEMANIVTELQSAGAAAERIFSLLDEAPESADAPDAAKLCAVRGDVELENVSFGYEKNKAILHHISLSARAGQMVAIVGATGAGKTTLINLLMRFYDPDDGHITIDSTDIRQAVRSTVRGAYAMVLQDTWLFHGSVFENIAYGRPDTTREEVETVCRAACVHDFIMQMKHGYDTILDEASQSISQGQKQLLTIARAMLMDARMLILDEATSSVDTSTEKQVQQAMRALMRGKTCFVIAHRLSTIENADLILVVEDGDIVEQGAHRELLGRAGRYSRLYRAQFENG